jgi:hypothetical protein
MNIEIAPRGFGKTMRLIAAMAADPARSILITHSAMAAHETLALARKTYPQIQWREAQFLAINSSNLRHGRQRPEWRYKYIDNIDLCVEALFGEIALATMRGPEHHRWVKNPPAPSYDEDQAPRPIDPTLIHAGPALLDTEAGREILTHEFQEKGWI